MKDLAVILDEIEARVDKFRDKINRDEDYLGELLELVAGDHYINTDECLAEIAVILTKEEASPQDASSRPDLNPLS